MSVSKKRPRKLPQTPAVGNRSSAIYVIIVFAVVFSLILAGLSMVDFSGLLSSDEPTPNYDQSVVDEQRKVVEQNPDDAGARALLASALVGTGDIQGGIREYEESLRLDPENTDTRLSFGQVLENNGYPQDAEFQYQHVLEQEPENHTAHYFLARLYWNWQPRRTAESVHHYQKVIEYAPDSFYAEQSRVVLETMDHATPVSSPVGTP